MIGHLHWTQRGQLPDLPEIREKVNRHGGIVVQYQIVFSAFFFSRTTTHLEWVAPNRSRGAVGLKYAAWCAFIGWWSLTGLILTPAAIINNMLGGANVTRLVMGPPPLPGQSNEPARRELRTVEHRKHLVILGMFILYLVLIFIWLATTSNLPNPDGR